MQVSELIATLHHEVAKGYNFIAETKNGDASSASVLHINIERVEFDLPVSMSQQEVQFDPAAVEGQPTAFKRLAVPFTPEEDQLPTKSVTGKTIVAEIVGHTEKLADRVVPESVARMRITFKLVLA
jgi:hypothetical protein